MKKLLFIALACASIIPVYAQDQTNAKPNYRRSSLYTFLVRSDAQDAKLNQEVANTNEFTAIMESTRKKKADTTETAGMAKSAVAQAEFLKVEIPEQFNNHNLDIRVLDFDKYTVTPEEVNAANAAMQEKKKGGFGKFAKGLGAAALGGNSAILHVDTVENMLGAVLLKFYEENKTAPMLLSKWYNYTPEKGYDMSLIADRGLQDASETAKAEALASERGIAKLKDAGEELINNTFVLAVNLRYRSNKAIIAEAQQLADEVGNQFGQFGKLASKAAGATTSAIAGEGFSIQAVTYLYKLEWNDSIVNAFYQDYYNKPLEDLIASGICSLKYVGKDKSRATVTQSIFSNKPESELVKRAVARAIDQAICKLQTKHEVFRTKSPITRIDETGKFIYAQIGLKEGLEEKDEYTIFETEEDGNGKVYYNEVGTAKVVKGFIWDNRYGADEEVAELENVSDEDKKKLSESANVDAVKLGETKFEIKMKKGIEPYEGMLLSLKKKK